MCAEEPLGELIKMQIPRFHPVGLKWGSRTAFLTISPRDSDPTWRNTVTMEKIQLLPESFLPFTPDSGHTTPLPFCRNSLGLCHFMFICNHLHFAWKVTFSGYTASLLSGKFPQRTVSFIAISLECPLEGLAHGRLPINSAWDGSLHLPPAPTSPYLLSGDPHPGVLRAGEVSVIPWIK